MKMVPKETLRTALTYIPLSTYVKIKRIKLRLIQHMDKDQYIRKVLQEMLFGKRIKHCHITGRNVALGRQSQDAGQEPFGLKYQMKKTFSYKTKQ